MQNEGEGIKPDNGRTDEVVRHIEHIVYRMGYLTNELTDSTYKLSKSITSSIPHTVAVLLGVILIGVSVAAILISAINPVMTFPSHIELAVLSAGVIIFLVGVVLDGLIRIIQMRNLSDRVESYSQTVDNMRREVERTLLNA
jgi:hypothetical protein